MKTKYFILAALAGLTFAGCSSDDLIAEAPPVNVNEGEAPIVFTSNQKAFTRADFEGADAASKLGNKFVVFGYKGSETGDPGKATNSIAGSTVFDNYLVKYFENSANTTESNSNNWEYVGITDETTGKPIKHAVDHGITQQTIKYWDYSQSQYDFFAWSTGSKTAIYTGTPAAGQVLVTEMAATKATDPETGLAEAYTFTGAAADLKECYISDLVTVYKGSAGGTYNVVSNGYQKPVTLKFRQLGTKVRIGIYETVPGYSVKNVEFYSAAATNDASSAAAKIFTTQANEIFTKGTYTISFPTTDQPDQADNNQAHISFAGDGDQQTTVDWGGLKYTYRESGEKSEDAIYLGRTSNTASFAGEPDDNYYVVYLPNQNGTNLNLRVNYTLESIDGSGEVINVKGATAQVPSIYTAWKPGFAYTYLFKISDKTNGYTGAYDPTQPDDITVNSEPAGLYPITFDAVVVNAEDLDGNTTQETITTISNPSITTYQKGSKVVNQNEYDHSTGDIFVTVNDGASASTPDLAHGKVVTLTDTGDGLAALYTLPTDKAYTEADVVDALQLQDDNAPTTPSGTIKGRSGLVLTPAAFSLVEQIQYGVDGNVIDLTKLPKQDGTTGTYTANAMQFTAADAGTYAFVYTKKASTETTNKYQPVTKAYDDPSTLATETPESVSGLYRYKLIPATANQDVQKGVTYFENVNASTPAITAFLGQKVDNLFIVTGGSGTTGDPYTYAPARGYAQTGTTYYYTLDGQTYTVAYPVTFKQFNDNSISLYTSSDCSGTPKSETVPANNTAYYYNDSGTPKYCVIYPQRTGITNGDNVDNQLYVIQGIDTTVSGNFVACGSSDVAVKGMTYFDMYQQNNGVYYTKIIKVQ